MADVTAVATNFQHNIFICLINQPPKNESTALQHYHSQFIWKQDNIENLSLMKRIWDGEGTIQRYEHG